MFLLEIWWYVSKTLYAHWEPAWSCMYSVSCMENHVESRSKSIANLLLSVQFCFYNMYINSQMVDFNYSQSKLWISGSTCQGLLILYKHKSLFWSGIYPELLRLGICISVLWCEPHIIRAVNRIQFWYNIAWLSFAWIHVSYFNTLAEFHKMLR